MTTEIKIEIDAGDAKRKLAELQKQLDDVEKEARQAEKGTARVAGTGGRRLAGRRQESGGRLRGAAGAAAKGLGGIAVVLAAVKGLGLAIDGIGQTLSRNGAGVVGGPLQEAGRGLGETTAKAVGGAFAAAKTAGVASSFGSIGRPLSASQLAQIGIQLKLELERKAIRTQAEASRGIGGGVDAVRFLMGGK